MTPTVVAFQYNPGSLSRTFEVGGAGDGPGAGQRTAAPKESISLELELDASDAMEQGEGPEGVADRIDALVSLVSPRADDIMSNLDLVAAGSIEVLPPDAPVTLFVYGPSRVLPVQLTELSVTEEAFDASLAPLRARVSVGMRVLRSADLAQSHPAHALALANHVARETRAARARSSTAELGADIDVL